MPVCLHCGEIGPEGALFCAKCGYTLPQEATRPSPGSLSSAGPTLAPTASAPYIPTPPTGVSRASAPLGPPSFSAATATPAGLVSATPIAPPHAKYCVRCGTLISNAAVYCPVCQQPQP